MALAWVEKLNEQGTIFETLLSFFLDSLLHCIIKTLIKSSSYFPTFTHHTFSGHLKDISLLFNQSRKHLSNTTFFQSIYMYVRTLVGVKLLNRIISGLPDIKDICL